MSKTDKSLHPKRTYPGLYEKIVPVALGVIGIAIAVLIIIAVLVALGLFPGS